MSHDESQVPKSVHTAPSSPVSDGRKDKLHERWNTMTRKTNQVQRYFQPEPTDQMVWRITTTDRKKKKCENKK